MPFFKSLVVATIAPVHGLVYRSAIAREFSLCTTSEEN